jgi:hypothetical protein
VWSEVVIPKTQKQLESWARVQRWAKRHGVLSPEQIAALDAHDFDWNQDSRQTWTQDIVRADARRFSTRRGWKGSSYRAYTWAWKVGGKEFFESCCGHMPPPINRRLTDEELLADAAKYETKSAWPRKGIARARGKALYERCTAHMKELLAPDWTADSILAEAKRFQTPVKWENASSGSYGAALKRGKRFYARCISHMTGRRKWTEHATLKDAKRFQKRSEWMRRSPSSYNAARARGAAFFERCCAHMLKLKRRAWTKKELLADAKRYDTKSEWSKASSGAYSAAKKFGRTFYERCCTHMRSF